MKKKTPNHLNSVFKKSEGISIHQYINREKVLKKSYKMQGVCANCT